MSDKNNLSTEHRVSPEELEIYRKLKPFISHCLTLNHDINNPLAGIIGYTDFMLDNEDSLTKDQEKYLRQIAKCAERIRVLVTELSDEKIALSEGIDMHAVIENFNAAAKPLH